MKINVTHNFPQVKDALLKAQRQVPFALTRALTKTAQDVREAERGAMRGVFDRPTPFTLNALYLRPATKQRLEAEVWLKGDGSRDNQPGSHYLRPQIEGGDRPLKRFEQRLVRAGYMQASERAVPASGANLDAYGNISRGQIVKILSQLKTAAVQGDFSDATSSRRSRAKRSKEAYFVSRGPGTAFGGGAWKSGLKSQHLPRGIWVRRNFGAWGTAVKPVLLFVPRASYRARYKFFEIGEKVVQRRFGAHWQQSWSEALRTARFAEQGRLL